jgi:hypothetical protein
MKKHARKREYIVYVYLFVLFLGVAILFAWPSFHRYVLTHPQGMSEKQIREKKEIEVIAGGILGTWQSTDDALYTREFTDSEVIEWYDGEVVDRAPYTLFEGTKVPPQFVEGAEPHMVYLVIGANGDKPLTFSINTYSYTKLDMFYLNRGVMLRFVRK